MTEKKKITTAEELITPWPEDPIDFIEGDWKIFRSSVSGLYRYEAGGIVANNEVDAVQLIQWGMAKRHEYRSMTPWEGSGLMFAEGVQVFRDITDFSPDRGERKYFVDAKTGFYRVNAFWLIWKGYTSDVSQARAMQYQPQKTAVRASSSPVPWETDAIAFRRRKGYKIERGARVGIYRVTVGGVTYNAKAARLLEEGLAITADQKRSESEIRLLGKLSLCENYTLSALREHLSAVLPVKRLNAAFELIEFARLADTCGERVTEETERYSRIYAARESALESLRHETESLLARSAAVDERFCNLCIRVAGYRLRICELMQLLEQAQEEADYSKGAALKIEADIAANGCAALEPEAERVRRETKSLFDDFRSLNTAAAESPAERVPDRIRETLRAADQAVAAAEADVRNLLSDLRSRPIFYETKKQAEQREKLISEIVKMQQEVRSLYPPIRKMEERNAELAPFFRGYTVKGDKAAGKSLLASRRPYEKDRIAFLKTGFRISRYKPSYGEAEGRYIVKTPDKKRKTIMTAKELVNRGLAVRI